MLGLPQAAMILATTPIPNSRAASAASPSVVRKWLQTFPSQRPGGNHRDMSGPGLEPISGSTAIHGGLWWVLRFAEHMKVELKVATVLDQFFQWDKVKRLVTPQGHWRGS